MALSYSSLFIASLLISISWAQQEFMSNVIAPALEVAASQPRPLPCDSPKLPTPRTSTGFETPISSSMVTPVSPLPAYLTPDVLSSFHDEARVRLISPPVNSGAVPVSPQNPSNVDPLVLSCNTEKQVTPSTNLQMPVSASGFPTRASPPVGVSQLQPAQYAPTAVTPSRQKSQITNGFQGVPSGQAFTRSRKMTAVPVDVSLYVKIPENSPLVNVPSGNYDAVYGKIGPAISSGDYNVLTNQPSNYRPVVVTSPRPQAASIKSSELNSNTFQYVPNIVVPKRNANTDTNRNVNVGNNVNNDNTNVNNGNIRMQRQIPNNNVVFNKPSNNDVNNVAKTKTKVNNVSNNSKNNNSNNNVSKNNINKTNNIKTNSTSNTNDINRSNNVNNKVNEKKEVVNSNNQQVRKDNNLNVSNDIKNNSSVNTNTQQNTKDENKVNTSVQDNTNGNVAIINNDVKSTTNIENNSAKSTNNVISNTQGLNNVNDRTVNNQENFSNESKSTSNAISKIIDIRNDINPNVGGNDNKNTVNQFTRNQNTRSETNVVNNNNRNINGDFRKDSSIISNRDNKDQDNTNINNDSKMSESRSVSNTFNNMMFGGPSQNADPTLDDAFNIVPGANTPGRVDKPANNNGVQLDNSDQSRSSIVRNFQSKDTTIQNAGSSWTNGNNDVAVPQVADSSRRFQPNDMIHATTREIIGQKEDQPNSVNDLPSSSITQDRTVSSFLNENAFCKSLDEASCN